MNLLISYAHENGFGNVVLENVEPNKFKDHNDIYELALQIKEDLCSENDAVFINDIVILNIVKLPIE